MPHRRTARLASWQIWLLCLSGTGLWLSGAGWLLLHYYGQVEGEFGPEVNPLEPWMMKLHGLCLIPALLGLGGLFVAHVPKGWNHTAQRLAGIVLSLVLTVLVSSGYLLYYAGGETLRAGSSLTHWVLGLALPGAFVWHYLNGKRVRRKRK
ncbi:hypothetical protein MTR62_02535 [Novosphingobium sp. 1949]|uniref:DUF4405 domain-containing protein n=1 Tax=Novosphingobium organovorum TaxID=2930092 RepID=A0ABT0B9T4_9SPHN|nr:hypothetical protein [Novosphingobium organovorum]MCJ2181591.1 hypothetical protein [Novosphingobium organovorum]